MFICEILIEGYKIFKLIFLNILGCFEIDRNLETDFKIKFFLFKILFYFCTQEILLSMSLLNGTLINLNN
jgi:hypothetical protein